MERSGYHSYSVHAIQSTSDDYIAEVREAVESTGFEVQESGEEGEYYKIVLPVEAQVDE